MCVWHNEELWKFNTHTHTHRGKKGSWSLPWEEKGENYKSLVWGGSIFTPWEAGREEKEERREERRRLLWRREGERERGGIQSVQSQPETSIVTGNKHGLELMHPSSTSLFLSFFLFSCPVYESLSNQSSSTLPFSFIHTPFNDDILSWLYIYTFHSSFLSSNGLELWLFIFLSSIRSLNLLVPNITLPPLSTSPLLLTLQLSRCSISYCCHLQVKRTREIKAKSLVHI